MYGKRRRHSLEIPGVAHQGPLPMGSIVGNILFSSGIMGKDPATGELPKDPVRQAELAFQNMRSLVEAAGGSINDIGKVTVYVTDYAYREHVNASWLKFFPDPHDRPARHVILHDLPGGLAVQLEIMAVLE